MNESMDKARAIAITLLNSEPLKTPEVIRAKVALAISITPGLTASDADALVAQLMHESNVHVPNATIMEDPTDHVEWLRARSASIAWKFWPRYATFLREEKQMPKAVVDSLDELTEIILRRLEDPKRDPPWDCRGMVVGSVQSGKTGNYCGLVCKAIDAGYRLIVVLAGMHDNLRSQTQYRLDEGVLGRDSQKDRQLDQLNSRIGVGKLFGQLLPVHTLTNNLNDGDFKASKADTGVMIGSDPVILVVKKNGSILRNLLKWVLHVRGEQVPGEIRTVVRDVPLLLIDDEADNASINTKDKKGKVVTQDEVTAINGCIRELLDAFEKSAYVGYTATPFANIFINPEAETDKHGDDLFPRSFILNVSPPDNYVSPARVFGLDGDADKGIEPSPGLPLFRPVDDYENIFPPKHKKDLVVTELPGTLKKAIACFVLVCAARRARGQTSVHNSMLVHVTRFIDVQHSVAQLVQERVAAMRRKLSIGEGERCQTLIGELKELWETEFVPTSAAVRELAPKEKDQLTPVTWGQVEAELAEASARIEVKEINGMATDALDYVAHRQGFNVIAVGGDKLSRGLTLEGLSVSYFLRASQMYDTLMQMGRWFGYRPGYLDLCRLFTTPDLRRWYRHIALAEVELRREFDRMKDAGLTPRRYGLRVREHPDGLLVTALNKMSHARTQRLSYAEQVVQTVHFATDPKVVRSNATVVGRFLAGLGGHGSAIEIKTAWIWRDVPPAKLLDGLLADFAVASEGWKFQKAELMEFIRRQVGIGELTNWTVVLASAADADRRFTVADCDAGVAERVPEKNTWNTGEIPAIYAASNANIQSPSHQALDLAGMPLDSATLAELLAKRVRVTADEISTIHLFNTAEETLLRQWCTEGITLDVAAERLAALRKGSAKGGAKIARLNVRPKTHGLLVIYPVVPKGVSWPDDPFMGLVFSFPSSHTARAVDYKVNKVWQKTFPDDDNDD